jgi:hypothetical protein
VIGSDERVEMNEFVMSFNKWCQEYGYKQMNRKTIHDKLSRRGIVKVKKGKMVYFGISLNNFGEALYRRAMYKAGD